MMHITREPMRPLALCMILTLKGHRNPMKSKVRNISVGDDQFVWGVTEQDWQTVNIKVWKKGNKRIPWFEVLKKFDDPWINCLELSKSEMVSDKESSTPVTPSLIAAYIGEVKRQDWQAKENMPIYLKTGKQGNLEVTEL